VKARKQTRRVMLQRGLDILSKQGIEGLTVDGLCSRLGLTKGAFYHHFQGRSQFHAALLEYWMERSTEAKKALADQKGSAEERYAQIVDYASNLPHDQEKAIRAWALHSPLAAEYQAKVDASRRQYLEELLKDMLPNPDQAEDMATLVLAAMIGLRHLFPAVCGEARQELMRRLHGLMGVRLVYPGGDDNEILEGC